MLIVKIYLYHHYVNLGIHNQYILGANYSHHFVDNMCFFRQIN